MATGGRVRYHLKHNISCEECSVIFVGFAAKRTLPRRSSLAKIPVHILGDDIPIRARIHTINGFSAHADQAELLKWQWTYRRWARSSPTGGSCHAEVHVATYQNAGRNPKLKQIFDL
jgi:metallo-beta-lactamase family protein